MAPETGLFLYCGMLTSENKLIALKYFAGIYKENRTVDSDGVVGELGKDLKDGTRMSEVYSEFTRLGYIDFSPEHVKPLKACADAYNAAQKYNDEEKDRRDKEDDIRNLTHKSLTDIVDGYPKTERRANLALGISIFMAAAAAITIIVELNKDEKTTIVVPSLIDTAQYRIFYQSTYKRLQSDSLSFYKIESYVDSLQRRIDSLEAHEKKK